MADEMTNEEFSALGEECYGHGWRTRLARESGVAGGTITKWSRGHRKVPLMTAFAMRLLAENRRLANAVEVLRKG